MADIFDIAGRINSTSQEQVVTTADQIKDETQNKKQNAINADVARHETEIHGTGGIDSRLTDVEQMEQIVIDGGEAQIATGSDFTNPDATKRAKIPTVGAIVDGLNDGVYDVSKRNPTAGPNSDGKFTLDYILSNADTLIPTGWRHGGMTISFVDTYDNKYVQFRCIADEFTTDVTQWQGVDKELTLLSRNLIESGAVYSKCKEIEYQFEPDVTISVLSTDASKEKVINLPKGIHATLSLSKSLPNGTYVDFYCGAQRKDLISGRIIYNSATTKDIYSADYDIDKMIITPVGTHADFSITLTFGDRIQKEIKDLQDGQDEIENEISDTNNALEEIEDILFDSTDIAIDKNGYLDANGTFKSGGTSWKTSERVAVAEGDIIDYELQIIQSMAIPYVACYNDSGYQVNKSLISPSGGSGYTVVKDSFVVPSDVTYIRICGHIDNPVVVTPTASITTNKVSALIEMYPQLKTIVDETSYLFSTVLSKPYVFASKNPLFCGDSITRGFTDGSHITYSSCYPKLFCDAVGMSYTDAGNVNNVAVGGSGYTNVVSGSAIIDQLQSRILSNYDYIFIAAGTNDHAVGATLSEFETAVEAAFDYIDSQSFEGKVIIITPINKTRVNATAILPLDAYRNSLTRLACEHNFDVINGKEFPFPTDSGDYESIVFGDNIHPSELGYKLYAKSLRTLML